MIVVIIGKQLLLMNKSTLHTPEQTFSLFSVGKDIPDHQKLLIQVGGQELLVEIVNTSESTTQGLSGRSEIGSDGMLFLFPQAQSRQFWMKEMLFAIDIVWLHQGKVVGITKQVPPPAPGTPLHQLPTYASPGLIDAVLELPASRAAELQLGIGSQLQF